MGYVDDGGAPLPGGHVHGDAGGVPVAALTGDVDGPADVAVTLVARQEHFRLASGEDVDGYTLNGTSPGPTLHVPQGKLLEVRRYHAHQLSHDQVERGLLGAPVVALPRAAGPGQRRRRAHPRLRRAAHRCRADR